MFTLRKKTICSNRWLALVVLYGAIGCGEPTQTASAFEDATVPLDQMTQETDAGIAALNFESTNESALVLQPIFEGAADALWSLSDGSILLQNSDGLYLHENGVARTLETIPSLISDAVRVDGQLLIATERGLMTLEENTFVMSPLDALVTPPLRLVGVDENAFWLADQNGIHHWRNGQITRSTISGRNLHDLSVFASPHPEGDELLIWEGMTARSILFSQGNFVETSYRFDNFPTSVALNQSGLWVLDEQRLYLMRPDRGWAYGNLPNPMQSIHANHRTPIVYLLDDSQVWRLDRETLTTAPKPTGLEIARVHGDGGLLISSVDRVDILNSELTAVLTPPPEGPLVAPHQVRAQVNIEEGLQGIAWQLDGATVQEGQLAFELNPMNLSPGVHRLTFSASSGAEQTVTTNIDFEGPPSWEAVIEPISQDFCVNCHGNDARIQLLTLEDWVESFDLILYDVETGRMPLTAEKLTIKQVDMIRGWGAGGFPRQETP